MSDAMLIAAAQWLLLGAFAGYLASSLLYVSGFIGKRISHGEKFVRTARHAGNAQLLGVVFHALAIIARWQGAGHWPTSNMYEFIGFMAFTSMVAFQVLNRIYDLPVLGALISPVGVFLMAYSYVFPPKVAPLVPALKSYWMPLHVSMAALGEGFFAVAFGAALLYLLRVRGVELAEEEKTRAELAAAGEGPMAGAQSGVPAPAAKGLVFDDAWGRRGMEVLFYVVFVLLGYTLLVLALRYSGFQWVFENSTYHLPPIIGPLGEAVGSKGNMLGFIPMPLFEAPVWMRGKHMNTMLYSLVVGYFLYWAVRRFLTREPIGDYLARRVSGDIETLDEISYRAVAIGYPIFTLGGLVFAMLWAKEAWGDYWFWDPKETWALISWLFYSAYLHMRISQGWGGRKSAWMAVLGFGVILFTLVGVNLLIVGVHSYAGGDA
jgi:ABC-type transport system involved in cytochrome c biogenesis permease subunit